MGCSREGYDLFAKVGWQNVFKNKFNNHVRQYVLEDTFMQLICILLGHNTYDSDGELACKRCHKYVKGRNYHILCRRIMRLK
jgi:hypothetical protein